MEKLDIKKIYENKENYENKQVTVAGWVKSARGGKAFGFLDLNDGSSFKGVQVVFDADKISKAIKGSAIEGNIKLKETVLLDITHKVIEKIEVNTFITDKEPLFRKKFDEEPFLRELVSDVALHLENGLVIDISGFLDFCEVGCYESEDRRSKITFEELKKGMI